MSFSGLSFGAAGEGAVVPPESGAPLGGGACGAWGVGAGAGAGAAGRASVVGGVVTAGVVAVSIAALGLSSSPQPATRAAHSVTAASRLGLPFDRMAAL